MSLTNLAEIKDEKPISQKRIIVTSQKDIDKSENYFELKSVSEELNSQLNGNPSYNEVD